VSATRRRKPDPKTPSPAPNSSSDMLLDRYAVEEIIGRGGMATVYRAVDTVLDRPVAVKLLHRGLSGEPQFVEQFLRMERHIARLFHPHLVTIYDAGTTERGCFAVMEYVSGGSLRQRLAESQPLPPSDVLRISSQVADALQLLHSERIIHGDIKPDNVLLDEDGNAKLVDFGIAHLATTTVGISSESLSGSIPYLAPEQLENGRADVRSDIYALGLVTYELLSGKKAFDGENWVAVAAQRLARDPAPLRELCPELPADLERVVMRSLARDTNQRFESSEEFRQALLQVQPGASKPKATRPDASARPVIDRQPDDTRPHQEAAHERPAQSAADAQTPPAPAVPRDAQSPRRTPKVPRGAQPAPRAPEVARDARPAPSRARARPRLALEHAGSSRQPHTTPALPRLPRITWNPGLASKLLRGEHRLSGPLAAAVAAIDLVLFAIIVTARF
jgi:serine/threonine protein kinase